MSRGAWSDADVAYITAHASRMTDKAMGEVLGFASAKVLHIRKKYGIEGRPDPWTPERLEQVRVLYVVKGHSADDVGEIVGCSGKTVRAVCFRQGWVRDPAFRLRNVKVTEAARHAAARARAAREAHYRARKAAAATKAAAERSEVNDADLIADFINRKGVTIVPPGQACGLTRIEGLFGAYKPIVDWKQQRVIAHQNAALSTEKRNSVERAIQAVDLEAEPPKTLGGSVRRANASPALT